MVFKNAQAIMEEALATFFISDQDLKSDRSNQGAGVKTTLRADSIFRSDNSPPDFPCHSYFGGIAFKPHHSGYSRQFSKEPGHQLIPFLLCQKFWSPPPHLLINLIRAPPWLCQGLFPFLIN